MISIDTNILIRFLVKDDEHQAERVYQLFLQCEKDKAQIHISSLVILEAIWVLGSAYNFSRAEIVEALKNLLLVPIFKFQSHEAIQNALIDSGHASFDLSDLLIMHCSKQAGCTQFLTFDKKASQHSFARLFV